MRWWIASLPVSRLLFVGFGGLFGYALVGAAVKIATSLGPQSVGARFLDASTDFRAVMDMFRASLGDPLFIDESSAAQQ